MGAAYHAAQPSVILARNRYDHGRVSAESQAGPPRVRVIFENGDITRVEADDRARTVGRRTVPTRWRGRCCDYREMNGCRIPTRAVVSWRLEGGPFEYGHGRVTASRMK
jgi:hypothetical protein